MSIVGQPPAYFFLASSIFFILVTGLAIWKSNLRLPVTRLLIAYTLLSASLFYLLYFRDIGYLWMFRPDVLVNLPFYGMLLLAWVFLGYTLAFLRTGAPGLRGWWAGLLPVTAALLFDSDPLRNLADVLWRSPTQVLTRSAAAWYTLQAIWALLIAVATLLVLRRYAQTVQPLHRNRLKYLFPILAIQTGSGWMLLANYSLPGYSLHLLVTLLILNISLTHSLPDLRKISRQILSYIIVTVLSTVLLGAGFLVAWNLTKSTTGSNQFWAGAAVVGVVAILFTPLLALIRRLVDRLLSGSRYDAAQAVREYSHSISNILDMELLAAIVVGSVRETLHIKRGHLALVERVEEAGEKGYRLRDIHFEGNGDLRPGFLSFTGPVAAYLVQERHPLTQYDIDLLPRFQTTGKDELKWLVSTGMDVYIPILAHDEWIGLLMVGPRTSGDRYYEQDLGLLSALASQTAVSLENARLVRHLVELNNEVQQAYNELNRANQQLERLDRVKTDFINIASHELRTPITLVMGYSEMLLGDAAIQENPYYSQMVGGIRSGSVRLHEIVDSLLDIAKIDNRALDLAPKAISLPSLIRNIHGGMEKAFAERSLSFDTIELTNLPAIEADVDALQKVFYHLIVNAVKYTPDGGKVKVMERLVPADKSDLGQDSVEVIVSDTGIGIAPEIQELIFTKFYQTGPVNLHSSGKTKFKGGGPGLGLAIVRGIVEAHNGKVWAESPGHDEAAFPGSQFHVLLPLRQPLAAEEGEPQPVMVVSDGLMR